MSRSSRKKRKLNRRPSSAPQPAPAPQTSRPSVADTRSWPEWLSWYAGISGVFVFGIAAFLQQIIGWWAWITIPIGLLVVWWVMKRPSKRGKVVLSITIATILIATGIAWRSTQPSDEERQLDSLIQAINEGQGWVQPPMILQRSRKLILDHFSAFAPDTHHGWNELAVADPVSLTNLVNDRAAYDGRSVVTVGTITGGLPQDPALLVFLRPLDKSDVQRLTTNDVLAGLVANTAQRDALLMDPSKSAAESPLRVYCLITPRPFVDDSDGFYWAVKGTVLAVGSVRASKNGDLEQVAYMLCSSAERIPKT